MDPYAKAFTGKLRNADNLLLAYDPGSPDRDLSLDPRDNTGVVPKCIVVDDRFDWQGDSPPGIPLEELIVYEVHVKGFTAHPSSGVPAGHLPGLHREDSASHGARASTPWSSSRSTSITSRTSSSPRASPITGATTPSAFSRPSPRTGRGGLRAARWRSSRRWCGSCTARGSRSSWTWCTTTPRRETSWVPPVLPRDRQPDLLLPHGRRRTSPSATT